MASAISVSIRIVGVLVLSSIDSASRRQRCSLERLHRIAAARKDNNFSLQNMCHYWL